MIIRNFSKALSEQNWTAIFIEFFLLVAGVFVGIQAANWNDQQRSHASAQVILKNLHADYAEIITQGKKNEILLRSASKQIDETLALLRQPAMAVDGAELSRKLDYKFNIPGALQDSATQQELIFSGRMDLVEDDALRALLVRTGAQLAQAIELAGGKPDIQVGIHAAGLIFGGEEEVLGQSLESLQRVQNALDRQRIAD